MNVAFPMIGQSPVVLLEIDETCRANPCRHECKIRDENKMKRTVECLAGKIMELLSQSPQFVISEQLRRHLERSLKCERLAADEVDFQKSQFDRLQHCCKIL
jgi:hypothetical protein